MTRAETMVSAAPPVATSSMLLFGVSLQDWVIWATLIYTILLISVKLLELAKQLRDAGVNQSIKELFVDIFTFVKILAAAKPIIVEVEKMTFGAAGQGEAKLNAVLQSLIAIGAIAVDDTPVATKAIGVVVALLNAAKAWGFNTAK